MDFLDPEEILKKIPELADDLEEPDDCFTEGKVGDTGLLRMMLIRTKIHLNSHPGASVFRAVAWGPQEAGSLAASLPGLKDGKDTPATTGSGLGAGPASQATSDRAEGCSACLIAVESTALSYQSALLRMRREKESLP